MSFRLFSHTWLGSDYPTKDGSAVKDCIKKLIDPLIAGGCGWDWDIKHCPNQEPIKLIPSNRVFAAFIKHTSGAKAMIGYQLNGSCTAKDNDGTCTNGNTDWWDAGFLFSHTAVEYSDTKICSLFFSFITSDSVNKNGADFHPEYSIRDEAFYDAQMTSIMTLANVSTNKYGGHLFDAFYENSNASMLKRVNDSNICCHYICSDTEKPILLLCSCLQGASNGKIAIFGEIADGQKRFDYDISAQSSFRAILGCGYENHSSTSSYYVNTGEDNIKSYVGSSTYKKTTGCLETRAFNIDGNGIQDWNAPYCLAYQWSSITPRTASQLYDTRSIYSGLLRSINPSGLIPGQVYDKGKWCYIGGGTNTNGYNESMSICVYNDIFKQGIAIRWDDEFNQGNRIIF